MKQTVSWGSSFSYVDVMKEKFATTILTLIDGNEIIRFEVTVTNQTEVELLLPSMKRDVEIILGQQEQYKRYAAVRNMDDYEEFWKEEDEPPVDTEKEFMDRLRLTHISRNEDGSYGLQYADGHMFGGHSITIHLDSNFNCENSFR